MEELEKNETSTQAEENTVSLASAQALADALAKIEAYTPTTWVDNSSPDIDAEHLNKPEQAIKRVTDALNSAVDVIKDLQSQVTKNAGDISTVNNNLGNKAGFRKVILDDTTATDREDLLKKKAKLIYDNQLGDGFYALVGGWAGKGYGFGIAEITSGKIMFLYMLMDTTYKCICDNLPTQSNFVYYQEGIIKAADSFKWNEVEISLPSLAANGGEVFGLTYTIPDSYFENGKWATAAMCGFSLSGNGYTSCTITMCKIIDKNIQYSVKNIGSTALSDIKLKVFIMFART
jgi:hypothetical protein